MGSLNACCACEADCCGESAPPRLQLRLGYPDWSLPAEADWSLPEYNQSTATFSTPRILSDAKNDYMSARRSADGVSHFSDYFNALFTGRPWFEVRQEEADTYSSLPEYRQSNSIVSSPSIHSNRKNDYRSPKVSDGISSFPEDDAPFSARRRLEGTQESAEIDWNFNENVSSGGVYSNEKIENTSTKEPGDTNLFTFDADALRTTTPRDRVVPSLKPTTPRDLPAFSASSNGAFPSVASNAQHPSNFRNDYTSTHRSGGDNFSSDYDAPLSTRRQFEARQDTDLVLPDAVSSPHHPSNLKSEYASSQSSDGTMFTFAVDSARPRFEVQPEPVDTDMILPEPVSSPRHQSNFRSDYTAADFFSDDTASLSARRRLESRPEPVDTDLVLPGPTSSRQHPSKSKSGYTSTQAWGGGVDLFNDEMETLRSTTPRDQIAPTFGQTTPRHTMAPACSARLNGTFPTAEHPLESNQYAKVGPGVEAGHLPEVIGGSTVEITENEPEQTIERIGREGSLSSRGISNENSPRTPKKILKSRSKNGMQEMLSGLLPH